MFDVIVAGHICFDVIPDLRTSAGGDFMNSFTPGKLIDVGAATVSTGGPVSNTGIALHKLGVKTGFMGKVGNDFFGQAILHRLRDIGADKSMTVVEGESTSYTLALAPPKVDRIFLHHPGANNTFGAEDVNFDFVAKTQLFHLGYPPLMRRMYQDGGKELTAIFKRAKEAGATTSLDMALPDPASPAGKVDWAAILAATLPYVDLYLPSVEETLYMLDRPKFFARKQEAAGKDVLDFIPIEDVEELGDKCLSLGAGVVALKSGHLGMYLRTGTAETLQGFGRLQCGNAAAWANRQLWEPSFHVPHLASATGSGDSSIAGFLGAFVRGLGPEQCVKYGCAVGGFNVMVFDAVSGIKSWEETTAAINAPWAKNKIVIRAAGWTFDEAGKVWRGPKDSN